ncbi:Four helix bundle protein [Gammaproteobacteria bacterium]
MGGMNRDTPLWRDANRLLVAVEEAVRQFPRYHKYTVGTDLRRQALNVCRLIGRAATDPANRLRHLERLVATVDDLKLLIQLSKEIKALTSFSQFQTLSELAVTVGRQSGGWHKQTVRH